MLNRRYITLFFAILCTAMQMMAQGYVRTILPNQRLLPVGHITQVLQDSEGYFWYATPGGGLCRDNGYQIDVIRNDRNHPGQISCNDILCLKEDAKHNAILFGTYEGLHRVDKSDYSITRYPKTAGKAVTTIPRISALPMDVSALPDWVDTV